MPDPDPKPETIARRQVERAEAGDQAAADRLNTLEETASEAATAVEQETSEPPGPRGLSR